MYFASFLARYPLHARHDGAPTRQSDPLSARSGRDERAHMLQALLHVGALSLTLYAGPSTPALRNVAASIELPESGLVLEVADSLIAPGGKGLFVRCMQGVSSAARAKLLQY